MPQADTNRVRLTILEEDTLGKLPDNPVGQVLRNTAPEFNYDKSTSDSDEIREDTRNAAVIELGGSNAGTINFELSMVTFNKILEGLFGSVFSTAIDLIDTVTVDLETSKYTAAGTPFVNAVVGQWLYFGVFVNAGNNGWKRIITKNVNNKEITVSSDSTLVDEADAANVTIKGQMLRDGTTVKSFGAERSYLDIGVHELIDSVRFNTMGLSAVAKQKVTGSFAFVGRGVAVGTVKTFDSYTAANTNPIVNATHNLGSIMKDEAELSTAIQSIGFEYSRNLDAKDATRNATPISHRFGTQSGTGTIVAYFEDKDLYQVFLDHTEFSFSFALQDADGKRLRITMDSCYITGGGSPNVSGKNQDAIQNLAYMSKYNALYDCQVQVDVINA
jgi:hypothetical protein